MYVKKVKRGLFCQTTLGSLTRLVGLFMSHEGGIDAKDTEKAHRSSDGAVGNPFAFSNVADIKIMFGECVGDCKSIMMNVNFFMCST